MNTQRINEFIKECEEEGNYQEGYVLGINAENNCVRFPASVPIDAQLPSVVDGSTIIFDEESKKLSVQGVVPELDHLVFTDKSLLVRYGGNLWGTNRAKSAIIYDYGNQENFAMPAGTTVVVDSDGKEYIDIGKKLYVDFLEYMTYNGTALVPVDYIDGGGYHYSGRSGMNWVHESIPNGYNKPISDFDYLMFKRKVTYGYNMYVPVSDCDRNDYCAEPLIFDQGSNNNSALIKIGSVLNYSVGENKYYLSNTREVHLVTEYKKSIIGHVVACAMPVVKDLTSYGDIGRYNEWRCLTSDNQSVVTEDFVNSKVAGLASETYVDNKVSGLASETYVNNAVTGFATETYVDNAVTGLATETYVSNKVTGLASETYVNNAVTGLATEDFVKTEVGKKIDSSFFVIAKESEYTPSEIEGDCVVLLTEDNPIESNSLSVQSEETE